jgi:hypothetical protein
MLIVDVVAIRKKFAIMNREILETKWNIRVERKQTRHTPLTSKPTSRMYKATTQVPIASHPYPKRSTPTVANVGILELTGRTTYAVSKGRTHCNQLNCLEKMGL